MHNSPKPTLKRWLTAKMLSCVHFYPSVPQLCKHQTCTSGGSACRVCAILAHFFRVLFYVCGYATRESTLTVYVFFIVDSHVKEFLSSKMWQATRTGTIERWKAPLPAFTKAPLQQPPAAWCMNGELRCACCNWFLSKFHSTKPPPSPQVNIQISPPCQQSKTRLRNMTDKLVLVMLASFSLGDVHVHTCVDLKIAHRCELRKRA